MHFLMFYRKNNETYVKIYVAYNLGVQRDPRVQRNPEDLGMKEVFFITV